MMTCLKTFCEKYPVFSYSYVPEFDFTAFAEKHGPELAIASSAHEWFEQARRLWALEKAQDEISVSDFESLSDFAVDSACYALQILIDETSKRCEEKEEQFLECLRLLKQNSSLNVTRKHDGRILIKDMPQKCIDSLKMNYGHQGRWEIIAQFLALSNDERQVGLRHMK